uniref:Uncharacterized protein n=1 Tax=Glossina palpalis gambiensis TaxID=67801 RepID=A0A1B0B8F6_9MUSC
MADEKSRNKDHDRSFIVDFDNICSTPKCAAIDFNLPTLDSVVLFIYIKINDEITLLFNFQNIIALHYLGFLIIG